MSRPSNTRSGSRGRGVSFASPRPPTGPSRRPRGLQPSRRPLQGSGLPISAAEQQRHTDALYGIDPNIMMGSVTPDSAYAYVSPAPYFGHVESVWTQMWRRDLEVMKVVLKVCLWFLGILALMAFIVVCAVVTVVLTAG